MMVQRYSKIIMCLSLAAFCFLVAFGNITDYGSNYAFVQHVLSMDTTFPGNALMYRSITSPALWTAGYWLIIIGEALTCVMFLIASWQLWQARHAGSAAFAAAKKFVVIATTLGFLVWYFGFMVIGGEWFAMWQSNTWNGQDAAFKFYMTMLAVLIFVMMPEGEPEQA